MMLTNAPRSGLPVSPAKTRPLRRTTRLLCAAPGVGAISAASTAGITHRTAQRSLINKAGLKACATAVAATTYAFPGSTMVPPTPSDVIIGRVRRILKGGMQIVQDDTSAVVPVACRERPRLSNVIQAG